MELRCGRSWGRIVPAGLLLGALLLPAGCKRLDLRKAEQLIRTELEARTGVSVTSVTCPEKRDIKAGDEFECSVVMEGDRTFTAKVTQKDDEGNVEWGVPGIMDPGEIGERLAALVARQVPGEVEVDCGSRHILFDNGATFTCAVRPASGGELVMTVTVTDDEGSINWEISAAGEAAATPSPAE